MRSSDLGKLFESATSKILGELFKRWGYEIVDWKIQSSGTQHGFDVFFRISKQNIRLSIFIECKASNTYNSISSRELTQKVDQLTWAGFPEKDIHLFFSPSRAISFDNESLTIEDDSHSFVIVDWMRKEGEVNLSAELFAAYRTVGSDPAILDYCDLFFSEIDATFHTGRSFEEVCADLQRDFDGRIAEHSAAVKFKDYRIINGAFWSHARQETHSEYIHYYYTKTDSTPARLRDVVASDFYVRNEAAEKEFERTLGQAVKEKAALVKILSKGGEGKSTFLYHIGKTHYDENVVVWLEDIGTEVLAEVEKRVRRFNAERPIIFLLDNAAVYGKPLAEFARKLTTGFRKHRLVLVLAEREFRYQNVEDVQEFESTFNETHTINYRSSQIRDHVFERLITYLRDGAELSGRAEDEARAVFLEDRRKSLTECTFSVIKHLKATEQLSGYNFDWDDWDEFARNHAPGLQRLYLVLSTFYQFGYSLDLAFCASFLKDADAIDINTALRGNPNLPVYRRGSHLLLRHETIASWFLHGTSERAAINRRNSEEVFKDFLKKIDTPFSRNLFIWLCIKNRDFRHSHLARYVDDTVRASILESFIEHNPSELKCRTELSKIYQRQGRWDDAEAILLVLKNLDPRNLHARTELSKIYQQQRRWQEAEDVLLESLRIDPEQLHPRTELSRIYQRQKRWDDAIKPLKEYIEINPDGLHPRTELSKIYQQQRRWQEAEDILLESLRIDPGQLHPRTELSRIYQQQKRWQEAEDVLLESLRIDPEQLHPRTELSRIYQRQKRWQEAEDVLLDLKRLDSENLQARTELSRIYQRQRRWREAEDVLLESLRIDPEHLHARTELSKIYQQQRRWQEAEDVLLESLRIDPEQLHPRTELSRIYQWQKRWREAEDILLESLRIDPEQLHPRTELSRIYQRQRRWQEAEDVLLELLIIEPEDLQARTELSKIYQRQRRWREAEDVLLELLAIDPENLQGRTELSKLFQKQKRLVEAETLLKECLDINPNDINALLELGRICSRDLTRRGEAERLFQQILEVEPDDLFARIELAGLYLRMRRYGEREKILFEIYDAHPGNIPTLMALAQVFTRFRKYRVALRLLESALKLREEDLITIAELIWTYKILRYGEKVREYIGKGEEILRRDPLNRHRDQFERAAIMVTDGSTPLSLNEVGFISRENGLTFVEREGARYQLNEHATVNNRLKAGDKVYFAVYARDGNEFCDFVEPYFADIDRLDQLR